MIRRGLGDDRGSVVAEFAVALPAVALVLLLGAGALGACSRQVAMQDAAADAARLVARGESEGRAVAAVAAAVAGAQAGFARPGDLVCVTATAGASVIAAIPVTLTASSCALDGGR
jgi:Flp pilus assembly protein TadG